MGEADRERNLVDVARAVGHYFDLSVGDGLDALFRYAKHVFNPPDNLFFKQTHKQRRNYGVAVLELFKMKRLELEGADDIEIRITKRRDGLVVTLTGTGGQLLFQLYQIKGSVTVCDERAAYDDPYFPRNTSLGSS